VSYLGKGNRVAVTSANGARVRTGDKVVGNKRDKFTRAQIRTANEGGGATGEQN
jgi:hypothetical protein